MKALFLAGGTGTRLWPLSRQKKPKQLHSLVGKQSLITQTIDRMAPIIKPEDIWIVTSQNYAEQIAYHSPGVPREQIIGEPSALGTCLAVGLGLLHIARKFADATVVVGWSDAYIGKQKEFHQALELARRLAEDVAGVILAVPPTYAATGYGYIESGNKIAGHDGCFEIVRFEEKPLQSRAAELINSGRHFWNPGISVWRVSKLLELIETYAPDHFVALQKVNEAIGEPNEQVCIIESFTDLDPISIDNAIFEKADRLATIPVDLDWNDIGSWAAVYDVQANDSKNVTLGAVVTIDTESSLIFSQKKLIATLGVSDLVIVETEDAILVMHKDQTERMKEVYDAVKEYGGLKYL